MKIALGYSHLDAPAALRLLRWIKFLGGVSSPLLVVASRRAAALPITDEIKGVLRTEFPGAEFWLPPDENERGWPWSPTHLFGRTLAHAKDDILWIEPDVVPLVPEWFDRLHAAFRAAGTPFVGRRVCQPPTPDHMTGVGFYRRDWRRFVPQLHEVNPKGCGAWDVDRGPDILAHFTETKLIQHNWMRHPNKYTNSRVEPGAVLYHQDKTGLLIDVLRPGFVGAPTDNNPKHYLSEDCAKAVEVIGHCFPFERCEYFAPTGTWWGIYTTADPTDKRLLDVLVARGAISALSAEDCAKLQKKRRT